MERADNTARILDVNYHMLLEQPPDTYKLRWDPLIAVTGERTRFYKTHGGQRPDRLRISRLLGR